MFEISIVCHVFVFVVLAGGWGFSLFGGCSGLSAVFSRVRGSSGFSLLLASLRFGRGGWGAGCRGFSRVRGWVRLVLAPCGGGGWVRLARPAPAFLCGGWVRVRLVLAPCGGGGWVCLCVWFILGMRFPGVGRAARLFFGGWVCLVSCFVFAVFFGRVRGGVSGCFCFRSALPCSGLGGVGLGWGCFFSGCCARSGFGLVPCWGLARVRVRVLVLFGEFDPGSGRTLAACLTHASRTGPSSFFGGRVEWRTGEYHVSNLPSSPG